MKREHQINVARYERWPAVPGLDDWYRADLRDGC